MSNELKIFVFIITIIFTFITIFKNSSNDCKVAILFSGGIDCTVLALLADSYVPKHQPIDLLNVAFPKNNKNNYDLPDRKTGLKNLFKCLIQFWF